jgi:hypothetical protein
MLVLEVLGPILLRNLVVPTLRPLGRARRPPLAKAEVPTSLPGVVSKATSPHPALLNPDPALLRVA